MRQIEKREQTLQIDLYSKEYEAVSKGTLVIVRWLILRNFVDVLKKENTDLLTTQKLLKIMYIGQGVVLASKGIPLFNNQMFISTSGPIIKEITYLYKNQYTPDDPVIQKYCAYMKEFEFVDALKEFELEFQMTNELVEFLEFLYQLSAAKTTNRIFEEIKQTTPWQNSKIGEPVDLHSLKIFYQKQQSDLQKVS
jgi:uncharacterized phage-associated protein